MTKECAAARCAKVESGGENGSASEIKKREVSWPLADDQKLVVKWEKEMFRPSDPR